MTSKQKQSKHATGTGTHCGSTKLRSPWDSPLRSAAASSSAAQDHPLLGPGFLW